MSFEEPILHSLSLGCVLRGATEALMLEIYKLIHRNFLLAATV